MSAAPHWIGVLTIVLAATAAAQVPVTREPRHRVVFEDPQFRILDVDIPPGEKSLDHTHEHDIVTIAMTAGAATRTQAPGQPLSEVRPLRPLGDASVSEYTGKPDSHVVANVGDVAYRLFAVENLRPGKWSGGTALSARGTTLARESRAFRVYDVRLVQELTQIMHTHAATTIAVLIGGRAMSQGNENKTGNPAAPIGLKQLVQPGEWVLVPAGEPHFLVRLGNQDARIVEIEVR